MPSDTPPIPKSLSLTEVCYEISKILVSLSDCDTAVIVVQDEHGWREYVLSKDGNFGKRRVKVDPEKRLEEVAQGGTVVELEGSGGVVGWIVLPEFSGKSRAQEFLVTLKKELPKWLELVRKYREARRQAVKDGLTDLFNYRHFMEALQREIEKTKKFCSLVVMDVDDFKKYNDHFGHLQGSSLLTEIAVILRRSSSAGSLVAKYGGDEFAIILPETSKEESFLVAQGIRHRIERCKFYGEEESQPNQVLTVSGGVATYPLDARDAFGLFDQADRAMYEAKRKGKNRIMYLD